MKKCQSKSKFDKGITLISVIITIIVMLILLGVSVDIVLDGAVFNSAKRVENRVNDMVVEQQNTVEQIIDERENLSVPSENM